MKEQPYHPDIIMSRHYSTRGTVNNTKRSALLGTLREILDKEKLLDTDELAKVELDKKFEMLTQAILNVNNKFANVHEILNDQEDGINPRLEDAETNIQAIIEENKQLRRELATAKGTIARQDLQIDLLRSNVTRITAKSMQNNILIGGLAESENEDSLELVREFLSEKMLLEFGDHQIHVAHRIGSPQLNDKNPRPRLMIAKLHKDLLELVLSNKKNLKGKKNTNKRFYSVKRQLPDE